MSWPTSRQAYDVAGRLSNDEDAQEESDELELTFVPASKRHHAPRLASSKAVPAPATATGVTSSTAAAEPAVKPRTVTVYEQERNAKVRQLLAEQHKARPGVVFSLDNFESAMPDPGSLAGFTELLDGAAPALTGYRGGRGGGSGNGGPRRYRMPNPNMSEEEQARYIRHRRNMAVTRNALREVDPDTLEYMQVTQAADQAPAPWRGRDGPFASYGGNGSGPSRGRGGFGGGPYRGRGGRGGGDGGYGFSPFDGGRGGGAGRGGRGRGFSPF